MLRHFNLGGTALHDDADTRRLTVLTDDERPLVFYGDEGKRRDRTARADVEMNELLAELLIPFSYQYMLKAMWVSALVGGVCAFLSAYLMLKGWSLMGDALAHSIVPGVAGAYILGFPFAIGAFFAGILASFGMQFVKQHTRLREDAVIGLVFTSLFALGLLMASIWPTSVSIQTIVLGNILAISDEDVVQVAIIAGVSLLILALKWKDLMVTFFDESHARSLGLNTGAPEGHVLHAAQRLHGRGAADRRRLPRRRHGGDARRDRLPAHRPVRPADRDQRRDGRDRRRSSAPISATFIDGATGGVIVSLQTLLFLAAFFFAPKHGIVAARRRRHGGRGGARMIAALEWITLPLQLPVHAAGADRVGDGRRGLRGALLLSRAQGLVADGRRDLARGAARHRDRLRARPAARARRLRGRALLRARSPAT